MTSANIDKPLLQVSQRLGIEGNALKKAEELLRSLQLKDTIKLNYVAMAVICLELATIMHGAAFDKEKGLLLAGLKPTIYQRHLNNIEKILQLDKIPSVSELCVKMSCIVVKELAEDILDKYQLHHLELEFNHPQYVAICVYTACKLKSVKVHRAQFVTASKLKHSQWKELETDFAKFTLEMGLDKTGKVKRDGKGFYNFLEETANKNENMNNSPKKVQQEEREDYEVWKARILLEARRELKLQS